MSSAAASVSSGVNGDANDGSGEGSGSGSGHMAMFQTTHPTRGNTAIDLDDIFNDIYFLEMLQDDSTFPESIAELPAPSEAVSMPDIMASLCDPSPVTESSANAHSQTDADTGQPNHIASSAKNDNGGGDDGAVLGDDSDTLTTQEQIVEKRKRNREHATRSRLRKKFLLESCQDQIRHLEEQLEEFQQVLQREVSPEKAKQIIQDICGDKEKYAAIPMPSGFGPVKTIMEPDFRLMSALSGSQQNFAISDPTMPDNPIVYVSQGFLDLTGYTRDQVLGRNCRFLQGPGTDQKAVDVIRQGIAKGVDTSVCLLNYRADGTPFWNQFFVAALRDADDNVVNFVGIQCEVSKAVVEKQLQQQHERKTAKK